MQLILRNTQNKNIPVSVHLASSPLQQLRGLMFRKYLPKNRGMLFIFDKEDYHTFWMLFTFIPLEAVFLDKHRKIIDIIAMQPHSPKLYKPKNKAKYALELNQGFCQKHRIKLGSKVKFG